MQIHEAIHSSDLLPIDAEVLLESLLSKDRAWIVAHNEEELSADNQKCWEERRDRRRGGEPIAYIIGEKEFYGRTFIVNPSVLIPRPATEGLINHTIEFLKSGKDEIREIDNQIVAIAKSFNDPTGAKTMIDIGTGSGCIAITLALQLPEYNLIATDISRGALKTAQGNADRLGVADRIQFLEGSFLEPVQDLTESFIIVSNPPYIPEGEELMKDVSDFEPQEALFAGETGMDIIAPLWAEASNHPHCHGIVLECRSEQANSLLNSAGD